MNSAGHHVDRDVPEHAMRENEDVSTTALEVRPEDSARRFLDACADIENTLKRKHNIRANGLGSVIREAEGRDAVVRGNVRALRVFTELRNVLSHNSYQHGAPVAAPLASTVAAVEALRDQITRPRPALQFAVRDVLTAQGGDALAPLLRVMASRTISQVPVYEADGSVGLLTTNAIARWVAAHIDQDGTVLIEAGTTSEALAFAEPHERVKIVPRSTSAAEVLELFTRREPPAAVLVTESGRAGETALGILAPTDVARLVGALTVEAY